MPSEVPDEGSGKDQLRQDVWDVFFARTKKIEEFDEPYRTTVVNAYRFSATRYFSKDNVVAPLTPDTMDNV